MMPNQPVQRNQQALSKLRSTMINLQEETRFIKRKNQWLGMITRPKLFMGILIASIVLLIIYGIKMSAILPKSEPGKVTGLQTKGEEFFIRGSPFVIKSGSIHYFRMPKQFWSDRLKKARYLGLNTIVTYIAWNLHEPKPGQFDFEDDLDIESFIKLAQVYGLYVILRPGPYICTEWDLGGLPSWLLHDKNMKLRSMYPPFLKAVDKYFDKLFEIIAPLQFSKGGPVIAWQVENEYGSYGSDNIYMEYIKNAFVKRGTTELLFICDNLDGLGKYKLEGVLQTINFKHDAKKHYNTLQKIQPGKPFFVTEFWIGWFDHWGEKHHVSNADAMAKVLKDIIALGGSFCLYTLFGGTNFGFMNGGNIENGEYKPTITSYDYDSPISEDGALSKKFKIFRKFLSKNDEGIDWFPDEETHTAYGDIELKRRLTLNEILIHTKVVQSEEVMSMESLNIHDGIGQSYGYIIYETELPSDAQTIKITNARDYTMILMDNEILKVQDSRTDEIEIPLTNIGKSKEIKILVENCGRVNYGKRINEERKGILGHVEINGKKHQGWKIYPLEFEKGFIEKITSKKEALVGITETTNAYPAIYMGILHVHGRAPRTTFLSMKGWDKGIVFVNGKHLGRYWKKGPQQTLFVPSPWLKSGENIVVVFEMGSHPKELMIKSIDQATLGDDVVDTEISETTLQGN